MAKVYTAQEMREMVAGFEHNRKWGMERVVIASLKLIEMLRQAADALEREEKRPKEYEYAVEYYDKTNGKKVIGVHYKTANEAKALSIKSKDLKKTYVRRAVGEWEEVKG